MTDVGIFGATVTLSDDWHDETVVTLALRGSDTAAAATSALLGARAGSGAGPATRATLVIRRAPAGDRDLAALVAEQKQTLAAKLPSARLDQEQSIGLGAAQAQEVVYRLTGAHPTPPLVQRHVFAVRDGWLHHFCQTSLVSGFEADRTEVNTILEGWSAAG